jgi:hypothetical protein
MLSGKNIGYIALLAIAGVLIYYFFFKKEVVGKTLRTSTGNTGSENKSNNQDLLYELKKKKDAEKFKNVSNYVGPQDCSENCNLPYNNRVLYCYNKRNGSTDCLEQAKRLKEECLGKCSEALPRYLDINQEVSTPIQENNYFSNLFKQGYV